MYSYKMFELFCEDESRHCDREKLRKRRRAKVDHIRRYGSLDWRFHLIGPCAMTSLHLREKSDVEQVGYRLFLTIVNSYWPCPKARGLTQLGFFLWGHFGYFGHISSLSLSLSDGFLCEKLWCLDVFGFSSISYSLKHIAPDVFGSFLLRFKLYSLVFLRLRQ